MKILFMVQRWHRGSSYIYSQIPRGSRTTGFKHWVRQLKKTVYSVSDIKEYLFIQGEPTAYNIVDLVFVYVPTYQIKVSNLIF